MQATIQNTEVAHIEQLHKQQKAYFKTGATRSGEFRIQQLKRLRQAIEDYEQELLGALYKDLHKSKTEAYLTEIGFVFKEIDKFVSKLPGWMESEKVGTPLFLKPGSSRIRFEPYGTTLIIAPWNYPFQLLFSPLLGAIAAGNTAILKPSESAPHTAEVMQKMVDATFEPQYIAMVQGAVLETQALLRQPFDYIFYTGGTKVGKIVYKAAAEHLTPVTLELGGKSPCIVHDDAHIRHAAQRIVYGKYTNSGQTCIAPDYLYVHESIKDELIAQMKNAIVRFYGDDPQQSGDYGRMITDAHYERVISLIDPEKIVHGGHHEAATRYIAPTILDHVTPEDDIMQEEIFGPLMPILTYTDLQEPIDYINAHPHPLALYAFTKSKATKNRILDETTSGGVCLNDTLLHIANDQLPFGGVGHSGMGAYHGEASFLTFSHKRGVLDHNINVEIDLRYPPYEHSQKALRFAYKKLL